jgi:ribonucleoside-diphosphate reductase beta chain
MRLFEKAKRFGIWNPSDIDLTQDQRDWQGLNDQERDLILRLTALFQGGEEAVTLDLLPLISTIAEEGRIEEEIYLTTFLWEEAKHTDFFQRFLVEVAHVNEDLSHYHGPNYIQMFHNVLPEAMGRLKVDRSLAAQAEASLTYNMIVEGVLAETGYHAYFTMLERHQLMPGIRAGIRLLKQDESRHIAYGVYLLSRILREEPALWSLIEERMNTLIMTAIGVIDEIFLCYDPMPFGLQHDDFLHYALGQFQKRVDRLERARNLSSAELDQETQQFIDQDDG